MAFLAFAVFLIITGTGSYSQLQGIQYVLLLAFLFALAVGRSRTERFIVGAIEPRRFNGVVIVSAFYLIANALSGGSVRDAITPLMVLACFLTAYAYGGALLVASDDPKRVMNRLSVVLLIMLCAMFGAQVLQGLDLLWVLDNSQREIEKSRFARYGGFINANLTNTISVMMLYGIYRMSGLTKARLIPILATIVCTVIVVMTQSRSGVLFLVPVVGWYLVTQFRQNLAALAYFAVGVAAFLTIAVTQYSGIRLGGVKFDPFGGLVRRVGKDLGEDERTTLIIRAIEESAPSAIFGNGYNHLTETVGLGAHNMFLESLVSYGIIGLAILIVGSVLLYRGQHWSLYAFCIVKPVVFSHGFYDQLGFQLVLGLVCAVDVFVLRQQRRSPAQPRPVGGAPAAARGL